MRLVSCHIENFGKLRDFTYCFDDDLNVIFAENGWGKSTLAAFLKVMFYGFDGENRRNEEGNERLRYKPWGGGVYGGSLTWSRGAKTYRMLRTFGDRRAGDTFSLYDEETGLSSSDFTAQTGEELFGIDRDSFTRTVFWSQSDHATFTTTSIQAKIGDLSAQQDDLPAYDDAVKRLRKEAQRLSPDRGGGLIRKKEDRIKVLRAEQARLPLLTAQHKDCADREKALSDSLAGIRAQRRQYLIRAGAAAAAPQPSPAQPGASAVKISEALADAQRKCSALAQEKRGLLRRGQQERREYIRVQKEIRQEYLDQKRRQKSQRAGAAASILLSAMVAVLSLKRILPLYFLLLCVLLAAYGIATLWRVVRRGDRVPETENLARLLKEKELYAASLSSLQRKLRRCERELAQTLALCESLQENRESVRSELDSQPAPNSDAALLTARAAQALSAFDRQEETCRAQLQQVRQQASDLQEMIRACEASLALLPALESEVRALRERYDTCIRTLSYLEEAKNLFASRYMNPFLRSFGRYYSMLTGQSPDSIRTDADFSIAVMDAGLPRDPSLMSEGTRDLIGLCRRMAMIDAMYPEEKPFLVLDDPFAGLDDERVKGGLRFLRSTSLEYQILYLTCHKSRF